MYMQKDSVSNWIERLSALHRSLLRKFAAEEGLQFVHVEILQYLSVCNHYSDTTQSISEYLGQTKGSISQSLGHLEEKSFIKRYQDKMDKRVFHLTLTTKGLLVSKRLSEAIDLQGADKVTPALHSLLASLQSKNNLKSFGVCSTCKFNQNPNANTFICGLTKEKLSDEDILKICRDHKAS